MEQRTRFLLVDDHDLFRDGLRHLLSYQEDMEVVGEAEDAPSAVAQARVLRPDVVLMDIDLPGMDGIAATREIAHELPNVTVVILTVYDDVKKLFEAIRAGAQGYLVKNIRSAELLEQLRGMARGEAPMSRQMAAQILDEFRHSTGPSEPEIVLSQREIEVLELVAARHSNKEIAARLVIAENTVKNHLKNILRKLHLKSRREAVAYGLAHGWLRQPSDRN
jgi:DNA-binding NarL/FixJ family response regulator